MPFQLSKQAAQDIRQIYRDGKRLFGGQQAHAYYLSLNRVFRVLADNPHLARERAEISPPVRVHPFASHLVVYIERQNGDILIIRVRHFRENWQS